MGWQVADDIEFYEQAEIHHAQLRPRWWVMWSPIIADLRAAETRGTRSHRGFPPRNRPR